MSERKVLNKYYPPDFDPSKIPRMKLPKNRQYTVRLMAPFNMRCATCGEYIYKGKKFNARKEDVENQDYLGIRIYRFYIKCTRCLQEISFKTDPRNTDYEIEAGATRNFMALKLAEEQAQREEDEAKEEEANNPMKLLENRTEQSKNEIELLESLEELKDLNRRQQAVDFDSMLMAYDSRISAREMEEKLQQKDEDFIKTVKFQSGQKRKLVVEEEIIELPENHNEESSVSTNSLKQDSTSILISENEPISLKPKPKESSLSVASLARKKMLTGLVRVKKAENPKVNCTETATALTAASNQDHLNAAGKTSKANIEETGTTFAKPETNVACVKAPTGLSLLGAYSGSDSDD